MAPFLKSVLLVLPATLTSVSGQTSFGNPMVQPVPGFESLQHGYFATSCGSQLAFFYTPPGKFNSSKPVLLLTHGWPQSSYIWRMIIPQLTDNYTLFVPDKPGYGLSSQCTTPTVDTLIYGNAIFEAMKHIYGNTSVIMFGHDRGGRLSQRMAINGYPGVDIKALAAFDIVPFVEEWKAFGTVPAVPLGYYHWMFLPNTNISVDMINAYGGDRFCLYSLNADSGPSPIGQALFRSNSSFDVYSAYYNTLATINASAYDYRAGATTDWAMMTADQAAGRLLNVPTKVVYSEYNLGKQLPSLYDVWRPYVANGTKLEVEGIGDERGHFVIEEAPVEVLASMKSFLAELGY